MYTAAHKGNSNFWENYGDKTLREESVTEIAQKHMEWCPAWLGMETLAEGELKQLLKSFGVI